jgi:hypothetical protein
LSGFKTVALAAAQASEMPAAPYRISLGSSRAVVEYNTGRAKGSIQIPATKDELTYLSDGPSAPSPVWDASHLVVTLVTEPKYDKPLGIGGGQGPWFLPMTWRILVAPLDANRKPSSFSVFATGRSALKVQTPNFECGECSGGVFVWPPNVAVSNGLIAYNVERPTSAHPVGAEILLRSLRDGSTVRSLTTPDYVYSLQLSGSTLVWMEFSGETTDTLPLRISTGSQPAAQDLLVYKTPGNSGAILWDVPPYILDGNLLTWQASNAGKVWQRAIDTGKLRQISPDGMVCRLDGFDGSNVVMGCTANPKMADGSPTTAWDSFFDPDWFVFWSPAAGLKVLTGQASGTPDNPILCRGRLASDSVWVDCSIRSQPGTFWTVPVSSLTGS